MKAKTTINEIATLAGVNPSTVSRALNSSTEKMISPALREKILSICDSLNYRPRISARSFVTGKTYKIGLISGLIEVDLTQPMFALYIKGLCNYLQDNNYTVTFINANRGKKIGEEILSLLRSNIADGYVLGAILLTPELRKALRESMTPIVGIDFHAPSNAEGFSSVIIDGSRAYRDIWSDIPPGARIAYVGPDKQSTASKLRKIREAGGGRPQASEIDEIFFPVKSPSIMAGRSNSFEFALENISRLRQYTVIWCPGDFTAMGIADALRLNDLEAGRDFFLIGESDIESFPGFTQTPWLSTVSPQMELAGAASAKMMLEKIASGDNSEQHIKVESLYIPRKSLPRRAALQGDLRNYSLTEGVPA